LPAWIFTRENSAPCQGTHTNVVERAIRPVTITRKNSLFAGSDAGARHWAIANTLIQSCKLNDVEPLAYLTDVLQRVVRVAPRATSFTRCYHGTGDRTAPPRQPPHSHSHALRRHHVNGALGHVAPGDRRLGSRCPVTQPGGAGWAIKVTSRCWGGDVSQPIIPPRSESDELRTPLRWNPASIAIPQPPSQRRSYNILRHCLVAASIEGVRDAAVPLTLGWPSATILTPK